MNRPTFTRDEARRARRAAWDRLERVNIDANAWSSVLAENVARWPERDYLHSPVTIGRWIVARAVAFEATADYTEAREMQFGGIS